MKKQIASPNNDVLVTPFYCVNLAKPLTSRSSKSRHIKNCRICQKQRTRFGTPNLLHNENTCPQTNGTLSVESKVCDNAVQLIKDLPHTSPLRRPLLNKLTNNIKPAVARLLFEVSNSTLERSAKCDTSILLMKSLPHQTRTSKVDDDVVHSFWINSCRASSTEVLLTKRKRRTREEIENGTPLVQLEENYESKYYQDLPTAWLYVKFQKLCEEQNINCCSIGTFTKLKPTCVKPSHKLEGLCPHCLLFKKHGKHWEEAFQILTHVESNKGCDCEKCINYSQNKETITNNSTLFTKYTHHSKLVEDKSLYFNEVKTQLGDDDTMVVMDFASGWEVVDKAEETSNEFHQKTMVKDMIVVIYEKINGKLQHTYFDFINGTDQSDHHYVRECFEYLLSSCIRRTGTLFIFSDGGPAHYKTARTVVMFGELSQKYGVQIDYAFFPSHHGKSICDSHTGIGKMYIKRKVSSREVEVESLDDIGELLGQLKNTNVVHLETIRRFEEYNVKPFDGVRKFHRYTYNFNDQRLVVNCRVSYKDTPEDKEVTLLLNDNQTRVSIQECLYCKEKKHYHRICTKFDQDTAANNFNSAEHEFLSFDGTYIADDVESDEDFDDDEIDDDEIDEESEVEDISEHSESEEELTRPIKQRKQTTMDSFFFKK